MTAARFVGARFAAAFAAGLRAVDRGLDGDALRALALGLILAALAGVALLIRHGHRVWRTSLPMAPFLVIGALLTVIA